MKTLSQRSEELKTSLKERILVLDGAMGTSIQSMNLSKDDFGGSEFEGCNENLVLTRPDIISKIHEDFLKAGCDIIETNTFGGTPLVLGEYNLENFAKDINIKAAKIAKEKALLYSKDKKRFVAGSIGPTTKAISITGGISFNELKDNFYIQAEALLLGGVDYFLIETSQDTRNIKACLSAIKSLFKKNNPIPVAVSITIESMGTMLGGQSVESLYVSLEHEDLLYIGLNCATGPKFMIDHIRALSKISKFFTACVPNAGMPDHDGNYLETPKVMSSILEEFID